MPLGDVLTVASRGKRWQMRDPGGRVGRHLRRGRPYEEPLLREIADMEPTGAAVDVGAHAGNHAVYLAVVCGLRVHAFEADPVRLAQLAANVALNGLDERVMIHPYAAGSEPGRGRWAAGRFNRLIVDPSGPLEIRRVDDVLGDVDDVSVVKIDVEHTEADVLAGMTGLLQRCRPVVWSETHTADDHLRQAAVLERLGYRMTGRSLPANAPMERWDP